MAHRRIPDHLNMFAADKHGTLSTSRGNASVISDHNQNILNSRRSTQEFTEKLFGDGFVRI